MRKLMLATAALAMAGAAPALAQYNTPAGPNPSAQSNGNSYSGQEGWHTQQYGQQGSQQSPRQQQMALRHHIYHELSQAGFSDIHIQPRSFMVTARDRQGQPFMMILNPNSVTAVTAIPNQNGNNGGNGQFGENGNGSRGEQFGENGSNSQNGNRQFSQNESRDNRNWGPTGSSAMGNSANSDNAINSPNGNGTYER